jgi:iron complex outermembrane receptor protein
MRHTSRWTALSLAFVLPTTALGQTAAAPAPAEGGTAAKKDYAQISLEELLNRDISVAATKTRVDVARAPASVTILTPEDIRRSGATSLGELLRTIPGIDVLEAFPGYISVSARGTSESFVNNMLVLIDGRRFENQFTGVPFLDEAPILLEDIRRIEVVKGPVGALYGTNALAGVISVTTYAPDEVPGTLVSLRAGNRDTYRAAARQAGRLGGGSWSYKLSAGYDYSSTWGSLDEAYALPPAAVRKGSVHGVVERRFADDGRLSVEGAYSKGDLASLTIVTNQTQYFEQPHLRVGYSRPDVQAQLVFAVQLKELRERVPPIQVLEDRGGRTLSLSVDRTLRPWKGSTLTLGGNARYQRSAFTSIATPHSQAVGGVFVQEEHELVADRVRLSGAVGVSHHPEIPLQVDGNAALIVTPVADHTLRLSFGRAHRDPAFLENFINFRRVFGTAQGYQSSNRDLAPEAIVAFEAGYHGRFKLAGSRLSLFAEAFREDLDDLIGIVTRTVPAGSVPEFPTVTVLQQFRNVENRRGHGFEAGGEWERTSVRLAAHYSYQRFENADTGQEILRNVPRHKLSAGARATVGRLEADLWVHSVSRSIEEEGYLLVNPRLGLRAGRVTLAVQAFNALDDRHIEMANERGILGERLRRLLTVSLTLNGR